MSIRCFTVFSILLFGVCSQAGTWTCKTGLNGHDFYDVIFTGDEFGAMASPAKVSFMGMLQSPMPVVQQTAQAGELARLIVGGNDPRSKNDVWIMSDQISPGTHRAYSLLSNFAIKQPLEGVCVYSLALVD